MSLLPEELFGNPPWHALHTRHRQFAQVAGDACRYRGRVAPFAAVAQPVVSAMKQLHSLLPDGDSVWLFGADYPLIEGLAFEEALPCLQMAMPETVTLPAPDTELLQLSDADAPDMVALTDLAYRGFFRPRTCDMGVYFGVRAEGELIAMGGERLMLDGYTEISAVCTHPEFRGRGYAAAIMGELVRRHRFEGTQSLLHVGSANARAIELYLRMGFVAVRDITVTRISRTSPAAID